MQTYSWKSKIMFVEEFVQKTTHYDYQILTFHPPLTATVALSMQETLIMCLKDVNEPNLKGIKMATIVYGLLQFFGN